MDANKSVAATFAGNAYTLYVYRVGGGSGTITNPAEGTHGFSARYGGSLFRACPWARCG